MRLADKCQSSLRAGTSVTEQCKMASQGQTLFKNAKTGTTLETDQTKPEPTNSKPGSKEKLDVLAERARLGQDLAHPEDMTIERTDDSTDDTPAKKSRGRPGQNKKRDD